MRTCERSVVWIAVTLLPAAHGIGAEKAGWTQSAPVIEREPGVEELAAYPRDGQTVQVNPPGFTWTPHEKAKTYRLEVRRVSEPSRSMLCAGPLSSTVFALSRAFDPGDYVWQVIYLDAGGAVAGASQARRFQVPAGLTPLGMPDVARLKELPRRRLRLK